MNRDRRRLQRAVVAIAGLVLATACAPGFFLVDRAAGNYEATTSTEVERKLTFTLEPGQTRYTRYTASGKP